jgi:hypothetical protein
MTIKTTVLVAVAAVGIFLAGTLVGFPSASAQDSGGATPPAGRHDKREQLLDRVAGNLGIEVTVLEQAIKDAKLSLVDEALADGRISEEQAEAARERINSGEGAGFGRLTERHHKRHDRAMKVRGAVIEQAAAALGIAADELKDELRSGKSIADVAAERGVTLDDVKSQILDAAKTKLDGAVAEGRIDQAHADQALQRLSDGLDELLNRTREAPATP